MAAQSGEILFAVKVPPDTAQIGERAFKGCSGLTEITLPPGLTHIEGGAFAGCSGLTQINFPTPGLAHADASVFKGCPRHGARYA